MTISWLRALVVVLGTTVASVTAATAAPDARQIADSLATAAAAAGDVQATYDDATASGDAITIGGFKLTRTDAKTVAIPSMVVSGAAMREAGGFTADSIAFDGGTATRGKDIVTWKTGLIENVLVPSAEEIRSQTDFRPFAKLVVSGLHIAESNLAKPVTAEDVRVVVESDAEGFPTSFAAQIGGIQVPAEALKGRPQEKAVVDALGYEDFDVNIAVAGAFDRSRETMTLRALTINIADVGAISIKARVSGMSPGRIVATRIGAEARSEAMLESLEIQFDNAGVVERALDMHAALIWGTRADALAQVNAALPLVLQFIGDDAFQTRAASAFREFLSDPQSISFSAAPSAPVSLEQILDTGRSGLRELPNLLGADVSAN